MGIHDSVLLHQLSLLKFMLLLLDIAKKEKKGKKRKDEILHY